MIFLAALPQAAFSQSDSGEIAITVVDASTKAPIALARVLLDGAVIISEQTSAKGEVQFTDVLGWDLLPRGVRIVKRGYHEPHVCIVRSVGRAASQRQLCAGFRYGQS